MKNIKKRLVFYFFTFENFMDNRAIKIHLKCLKHYAHVFDEALFIISLNDTDNSKLIFDTESELLKLGFKDIRFKVHKNNAYCEGQPFFEEIVEKLKYLDGLTFFGHTKGVTNVCKLDANFESLDAWLLGMYYLNLEFIEEVEVSLCYEPHRFYGAFLMNNEDGKGVNWFYSGTFFWMNCQTIYLDNVAGDVEIPIQCHQRGFAETLPGLLYDWNRGKGGLSSHGEYILYPLEIYSKAHIAVPFLLGDDTEGYEIFKKEMLDGIA